MCDLKKLAISIPLSLMAIFFSVEVKAYSFTVDYNKGFYWKAFPVQMKRFSTVGSDNLFLKNLVDESVYEWENSVGKNIWEIGEIIQSNNYSGNYIKWSENFGAETGFDPSSTLAITIRYNRGTFFEQTVIILNGGLAFLRQNWGNSLKSTLLHELGHTIGLDHSSVSGAIMYPSLNNSSALQSDDIAGMNALVDSTIGRQVTGYVSPFSTTGENKSAFAACGTIRDIDKDDNSSGFMGSLILGILLILASVFISRNVKSLR